MIKSLVDRDHFLSKCKRHCSIALKFAFLTILLNMCSRNSSVGIVTWNPETPSQTLHRGVAETNFPPFLWHVQAVLLCLYSTPLKRAPSQREEPLLCWVIWIHSLLPHEAFAQIKFSPKLPNFPWLFVFVIYSVMCWFFPIYLGVPL